MWNSNEITTVAAPLRIKSLSYLSLRTVSPRFCNKKTIHPDGLFCRQIIGMERTIETICMKLLLRQQPVARDLRQISAAMKMITDMERIGDQAEDIVEIVPYMNAHPDEKYPKIREMAKAAQSMVTEAVDAYVKQDLELARKVMAHDDVVDNYFTQVKNGIIDIIAAEPSQGEYALDLLMIAKYFERIGDHCTNIAEWVEFSVTGVHKDCQ